MSGAETRDMAEWMQAPGTAAQVRATAAQDAEPAHGTPPGASALHDQDEYGWLLQQAHLLRAGRVGEIDAHPLADLLTDMSISEERAFESAMFGLLLHRLKVLVQPERLTQSWRNSISAQQINARRIIRKNPGMRPRLPGFCADAYADARQQAAVETRIDISRFPLDNPWTLDEALAFVPPPPPPRAHRAARKG